jgi:ribonuclease HI
MAVRFAVENGATHLLVRSDSQLIVNQINGRFRVTKRHLANYLEEIRRATEGALNFQIEWIPREENKAADELTWRFRPRRSAGKG